MIDIDDAILANTLVTPGKLSLGEGTSDSEQITIRNNGTVTRTYTLSHQAGRVIANTFPPHLVGQAPAGVTFTPASVELDPGESGVVNVSFTSPGLQGLLYGGWIRVTDGTTTYRVPFGGFDGDYQLIQVIAPGACSFPGIFKAGGTTTCGAATLNGWTRQAASATYNVGNRPDRPIVLYHLAHQSQRIEIRAVNASNQEFLVARTDLAERNPTNDLTPPGQTSGPGFFTYTWDGKAVFTNEKNGVVNRRGLPSGTYRLRIVVTKALADPANPAHTETWDSPTMNIVAG